MPRAVATESHGKTGFTRVPYTLSPAIRQDTIIIRAVPVLRRVGGEVRSDRRDVAVEAGHIRAI